MATALTWTAALVLGPGAEAASGPGSDGYAVSGGSPLTPRSLATDATTDPLGVGKTRPELSWKLSSRARDEAQTGYQIKVWNSAGRQVWDSGRVSSSTSQADYAGRQLGSRERYSWRVRVWDRQGHPSAWSRTATWETGLLDADDWSGAQWIGGPASLGLPKWPAGTTVTASSTHAAGAITYDTTNAIDGNPTTFWNDNTQGGFPDWLQVTAPSAVTLPGVTLYSSTEGGPSDFTVATLQDGAWVTQRHVSAVSKAYTQIKFDSPVTTTAVRITVDADWEQDSRYLWTRIGELTPGLVSEDRYGTTAPAPLLRTDFDVTKRVGQARLYISGLAYYRATINGERVGDNVLDPAFTMYDHRVNYATHDVTELVRRGENALGVELGRGFFGLTTATPWWNWNKASWHHEPELKAKLVVTYTDGSTKTVVTDDQWTTSAGPRLFDSVYNGEDYDARLAQPGWDEPGFDATAAGWQSAPVVDAPKGTLQAQNVEPQRVTETFPTKTVTEPATGHYVFDFGRTTSGWASLNDITGAAGTRITLRYGERLNSDGTVRATETYGGRALATDNFTLAGTGSESWEPAFTWQSFRYVEVAGLPEAPTTATMTGKAVHTDAAVVGSFTSSDALYNQIHAAAVRTLQNNMGGTLSDTPLYEKNGWMDDGTIGSRFIPLDMDVEKYFAKWADDMSDAQVAGGNVPLIVPSNGNGLDINYPWGPAPEWQGAFPAVVWALYQNYGDTTPLSDHYDALVRYVDYELGALDSKGLASTSLGDWVAPEATSDQQVTATAYVYQSVSTLASIAEVLGHTADATRFGKAADALRSAFNTAFFQTSKGYYQARSETTYRQTTNALPLAFGMVPAGAEKSVADSLAASVAEHNGHLATGSLGTSVLLAALSRNGHPETAARILGRTTYPSWGHWLANGADTLLESWSLDSRSRDHLFLGAGPEQWFYEDLAGLRRTGAGWSTLTVSPAYSAGPTSARATVDTVRGPAASGWKFDADGTAAVDVVVPVGAVADITLPATAAAQVTESGESLRSASGVRATSTSNDRLVVRVGSGTYHFSVRDAVR